MKQMGGREPLWDETDGFFYDVLRYPNGEFHKFRVRSLVGLIPLFAVERLEMDWIARFKEFTGSFNWFMTNPPDLVAGVVHPTRPSGGATAARANRHYNDKNKQTARRMGRAPHVSPYI